MAIVLNTATDTTDSASSPHVLLVEDDRSLSEWVADYLIDHGFLVTVALDGAEAIRLVEEDGPDLVLLDVNLPVIDGYTVCLKIRKFFNGPILMLTAREQEDDEVKGFQVGANDYLVKPVRPRALLKRIELLLAPVGSSISSLSFGDLTIDFSQRKVQRSGQEVPLTTNEFDLIWLLASNAGTAMSRDAIVSELRGIDYDGFDRSIDILVSRIRRKIEDNPAIPQQIKTVRGAGYLFVAHASS